MHLAAPIAKDMEVTNKPYPLPSKAHICTSYSGEDWRKKLYIALVVLIVQYIIDSYKSQFRDF